MSDPRTDPARPAPALRWQRALAWLLLGFVFWACRVNVGVPLDQGRTDGSWCWVMLDAFRTGKAFGTDLVWTYGPLGGLNSGLWVGEFEPARMYVWEVGFRAPIAVIALATFLRIADPWSRAVFAVTYVLIPTEGNVWAILSIAFTTALLLAHAGRPWAQLALTLPLAVLALEKMTGFVLAGACVAITAAVLLLEKDRRGALRVAAAYACWIALLWCGVCRQSPASFPIWLARSLELAAGYSEAMSLDAFPETRVDGWVSLGLAAAVALAYVACGARRVRELGALAAWLAAVAVAYKAGFVRASDHPIIYFFALAPLPYLLVTPRPAADARRVAPAWWLSALRHVLAIHAFVCGLLLVQPGALALHERISAVSFNTSLSVAHVFDPDFLRAEQEQKLALGRRKFELPKVKARVGDAPVDVVPCQHGVAVLNGLNLHIRPVIAGYATFSPALAELNARFFERPDAPPYVMLELMQLDYRPATTDDAAALQVLARDYVPVLCDGEDLLLQRLPDAPRSGFARRATCLEREVAFDEVIELHQDAAAGARDVPHVLALEYRYTLAGKLRTTLDQAPPLFARAKLDDGRDVRFRIVPCMVRGGIVFDPWIADNSDWAAWRTGGPAARPLRLLLEPPVDRWMFTDSVRLTYVEAPDLAPPAGLERIAPCDTVFETLAARMEPKDSDIVITFPDLRARKVATPSTMVFRVPAGHLRVQALHGLLPKCYTQRASDGARFRVDVVKDGERVATAWERVLDPRHVESDRGHQPLDVELDAPEGCEIHLATDGGPAGDATDDWAYWGNVRITDAAGFVVPGWLTYTR